MDKGKLGDGQVLSVSAAGGGDDHRRMLELERSSILELVYALPRGEGTLKSALKVP